MSRGAVFFWVSRIAAVLMCHQQGSTRQGDRVRAAKDRRCLQGTSLSLEDEGVLLYLSTQRVLMVLKCDTTIHGRKSDYYKFVKDLTGELIKGDRKYQQGCPGFVSFWLMATLYNEKKISTTYH